MSGNFYLIFSLTFLVLLGCRTHQTTLSGDSPSDIRVSSIVQIPCTDCEIDFKAHGNNPFWSLEMDFEQVIRFVNPDQITIMTPSVDGIKSEDDSVISYSSKTESSEMLISLYRREHVDEQTGEKYSHKVKVELKNSTEKEFHVYNGSGNFLMDYRLHNIWAFQEINDQKLNPESFIKGIPVIELFVAGKKIIGHDGCNQFTGTFITSGNTITFGPIASTLMACTKETLDVGTLLFGKYQFAFAQNQLILFRNNKAIMKLKNID